MSIIYYGIFCLQFVLKPILDKIYAAILDDPYKSGLVLAGLTLVAKRL